MYFSNNIVLTNSTVNKHDVNIDLYSAFYTEGLGFLIYFCTWSIFSTPGQSKSWGERVVVPQGRGCVQQGQRQHQEHPHASPHFHL